MQPTLGLRQWLNCKIRSEGTSSLSFILPSPLLFCSVPLSFLAFFTLSFLIPYPCVSSLLHPTFLSIGLSSFVFLSLPFSCQIQWLGSNGVNGWAPRASYMFWFILSSNRDCRQPVLDIHYHAATSVPLIVNKKLGETAFAIFKKWGGVPRVPTSLSGSRQVQCERGQWRIQELVVGADTSSPLSLPCLSQPQSGFIKSS